MDKNSKCRDCRYYKELRVIKNDGGRDIAKGLGNCSHLDAKVIGSDVPCENFKDKKK